jgi:sugar transferase EpsL
MKRLLQVSAKRTFDVLAALIGLIVLSPIFLVVALIIKINLKGPILFIQARPGYKGKIFNILKFRTMRSPHHGEDPLASDANRLMPLGSFLRALSLDELPELLNVLKGDMSMVGPRPLLPQYLSRYTAVQARRHEVRPGITGWAQINGRNSISWNDRFEMDVWYVNNRSFWLDMKILLMTVYKVFRREGISQPEQATCKEFMGKEQL